VLGGRILGGRAAEQAAIQAGDEVREPVAQRRYTCSALQKRNVWVCRFVCVCVRVLYFLVCAALTSWPMNRRQSLRVTKRNALYWGPGNGFVNETILEFERSLLSVPDKLGPLRLGVDCLDPAFPSLSSFVGLAEGLLGRKSFPPPILSPKCPLPCSFLPPQGISGLVNLLLFRRPLSPFRLPRVSFLLNLWSPALAVPFSPSPSSLSSTTPEKAWGGEPTHAQTSLSEDVSTSHRQMSSKFEAEIWLLRTLIL